MRRWAWLTGLLLSCALALGAPTLDEPGAGVLDAAEAVDHTRSRLLSERIERLAERPGLALLVVFQRGEAEERDAAAWLAAWQPAAGEPIAAAAGPDRRAEAPAAAASELPRGVMVIRLAQSEIDLAAGDGVRCALARRGARAGLDSVRSSSPGRP